MALPIEDAREDVASIFLAYLGRAPEYQAMSYYVSLYNQLHDAQGDNPAADDNAFKALSAQIYVDAGNVGEIPTGANVTNAEYVDWIYENVLGREADANGRAYWITQLTNGSIAREELVAIVIAAAEGDERDAAYVANRTAVAVEFAKWENSNPSILDSLQLNAAQVLNGVDETEESRDAAIERIENNAEGGNVTGTELTTGRDQLVGSGGDDVFTAPIIDNANTLQNGDAINGGGGTDTLLAEIGNSQNFAIQPVLLDVENVVISARTTSSDSTDNNTDNGRGVQIDAGKASGVDNWESRDSRADVIIEDVRLNFQDQNITRDVTITFRDSDPGNVDFAVYFDQQSLIAADVVTTNRLTVEISNPLERSLGYEDDAPLRNFPYDQFTFELDGVRVSVDIDLEGVLTYDDLEAALREAFSVYPEISVTRNEDAKTFFSRDGELRTADTFTLAVASGSLTPADGGWSASGILPPNNAFSATVQQGEPDSTVPLITSQVVLDNVGRGSTGGDLVIGGLSAGNTSTSRGVEQFDIVVQQSSKLQTISSTANTLEVINLVNEGEYRDVENGRLTEERPGNLAVLGAVDVAGFGFDTAIGKVERPSDFRDQDIVGADGQNNGFGITDVQTVNAAGYLGDIALTAVLTSDVAGKYLNPQDGAPGEPADDNVQFNYTLGSGDDALALAISDANFVLDGTTSLEDFELVIDAGAGDDIIEVAVYDEDSWDDGFINGEGAVDNLAPVSGDWYTNSKYNANLGIDAGAGNDTVHTHGSGDWFIDLGAGNDTLYADNSGDKALWVFNNAAGSLEVGDLMGDTNNIYQILKGQVTVSLTREANGSGTASVYNSAAVTVPSNAAVRTTDLHINQAIKTAINDDPVLGKLLQAYDGPSNSLIVVSLIDGQQVSASDLSITLSAPAASSLTPADIGAWNTANGTTLDAAGIVAQMAAQITAFNAKGDYAAEFGTLLGADLDGSASLNQADNKIVAGAGQDVIVLGTNLDAVHGAVADANDTVTTVRVTESVGSNDVLIYQNFDNGVDTIVNFTAGVQGTQGVDFLDFTSYDVDGVAVVANPADFDAAKASFDTAGLLVGTAATTNFSFVRLVEYTNDDGKYDIQLVTLGANAGANTDDSIQLIGTVDFGAEQPFDAYNFII